MRLIPFDLHFSFFCPPIPRQMLGNLRNKTCAEHRRSKNSSFEFLFPPNFINPKSPPAADRQPGDLQSQIEASRFL